ncbi:MAG: D-amino-acid dehydrogenase [Saprospiraceae bacterium]|jgi:D-amino-acid dehydrogenase
MDETHKVAITRLGNRVRAGGRADLAGFNLEIPASHKRNLEHVLGHLFPGATANQGPEYWAGLRPMTPNGVPIIGRSSISNLYMNTGHGTLGWTMRAGSGKIISDLVSETLPELNGFNQQLPY